MSSTFCLVRVPNRGEYLTGIGHRKGHILFYFWQILIGNEHSPRKRVPHMKSSEIRAHLAEPSRIDPDNAPDDEIDTFFRQEIEEPNELLDIWN